MENNGSEEKEEIFFQMLPFLRVFKDGSFDRPFSFPDVPPSLDPLTGAISKDVDIPNGVSARLYIPANIKACSKKLPLLIYIHGGGFTLGSARSPWYHKFMDTIVSECKVVAVSIDYRNAPEHFLPVAYEDSAAALEWIAACKDDQWLNQYADYNRIFVAGDSAGANIAHNMVITKTTARTGMKVEGMIMVHPYFWGEQKFESEIEDVEGRFLNPSIVDIQWEYLCPGTIGRDDPLINPMAPGAPNLRDFDCKRLLVFVAEKDLLKERGRAYVDALNKSGWDGEAEVVESAGEDHCFHFPKPECENAIEINKKIKEFIGSY